MQQRRNSIIYQACCIFSFLLLIYLTYRWWQVFYPQAMGEFDKFHSDFVPHINFALNREDYSLTSFIIRFLFSFGNDSFAHTALAVVVTANNVLTVITLTLLLRYLFPDMPVCFLLLASELALVCGPWIFPPNHIAIYYGACNGNLYHNMTMLFSRTLIPLDFLLFLKCYRNRHDTLNHKHLLFFTLCITVTTLYKASFAFAFIPMLAGLLLYDFIRYRAKYIKNDILLGLTVVPSGIACIIQYIILFINNFDKEPAQIGFTLILSAELIVLAIKFLRSFLLPAYTYILSMRTFIEKKYLDISIIAMCALIAIFQSITFFEIGPRSGHRNFDWGALAIHSSVFAVGIALLFRMIGELPKLSGRDRVLKLIKVGVGIILLLGHLATGVFFRRYFTAGCGYII